MKFGENLKKLRKDKGISQEELAQKVMVTRQSVSKWETGEAYPEMNNILELCKIFKCNINDLVNDSIIDLDSLDEDVKMSVVKFKADKQKKMKGLSKALVIISKIARVVVCVAMVVIALAMIAAPIVINKTEVTKNEIRLNINNDKLIVTEEKVNYNGEEQNIANPQAFRDVKKAFDENSKAKIIVAVEVGFVLMVIYFAILFAVLTLFAKLFTNINKGDTPFTLENVNYIKRLAYIMIASIVASGIGKGIFDSLLTSDIDFEFELFDLIEILFLFSMSYIFEYGYEMQLDSNAVMYGAENE